MPEEEDFEDGISKKFIQVMNTHLPVKRKTLKQLLSEDKPHVRNLDGSNHSFDKKELDLIASIVPEFEYNKLKLPIYLEMSSLMERGTIKISGRIESSIISRILHEGEEKIKSNDIDSMIVYYPHLPKIRKSLSTTTQFMFTM